MKPQRNVIIERTDGNTDPLLIRLRRNVSDVDSPVNVGDSATVSMDIDGPSGTVTIAGVANGNSSGIFAFAVATIPAGQHVLKFDIDVTENSNVATYGAGKIYSHAKVS